MESAHRGGIACKFKVVRFLHWKAGVKFEDVLIAGT